MSAQPHPDRPAREVIAPPHVSLRKEVGRDVGPPPLEYGEVRLWLVAKAPDALFAYWEFRPEEHPEALLAGGEARFYLRIQCDVTKAVEATLQIDPARGQCTTPAPRAGATCHAELGFFNEQGIWCFLARSKSARTPPAEKESADPTHKIPSQENGCLPEESGDWTTVQEARFNEVLAEDVARSAKPRDASKKPND